MRSANLQRFSLGLVLLGGLLWTASLNAADEGSPIFASPKDGDDYRWQGEYAGRLAVDEGEQSFGVQIVAGGRGKFRVVAYSGGLPGEGWDGESKILMEGVRTGDELVCTSGGSAELRDGQLHVRNADGQPIGKLQKVQRKSRTLGEPPPPHAIVLFDGSSADAFEGGQMTDDGLLMQGAMSHETFQDVRLHLEFRTPFMPEARDQGRGNSGVYLQGRYEVQILDSFGLEGEDNECGGIYGVKPPEINMAFPPFTWQTYDIDFVAPRFDTQGQKVAEPRVTVWHNGMRVQDNVPVPGPTRASKIAEGPEPGPLDLQDHGTPVRFRNIWIVKHPPSDTGTE